MDTRLPRAGLLPPPPSARKEVPDLQEGDKRRRRKGIKAGGEGRR